jgi:hypothetical protein
VIEKEAIPQSINQKLTPHNKHHLQPGLSKSLKNRRLAVHENLSFSLTQIFPRQRSKQPEPNNCELAVSSRKKKLKSFASVTPIFYFFFDLRQIQKNQPKVHTQKLCDSDSSSCLFQTCLWTRFTLFCELRVGFLFEMDFSSALFDSIVKGDEKALIHINDVCKLIHATDDEGCSALHWAALNEATEKLVSTIIELGADINALDKRGRSPLHYFCAKNLLYGATCILHHGADTDTQTYEDKLTPLHVAAASGEDDMVRLLLAYGASTSILNNYSLTARDINRSKVHL